MSKNPAGPISINPDLISDDAKALMQKKDFHFDCPVFKDYIIPNGFLTRDAACHALFYYAVLARRAYEENVEGWATQYEGNLSNTTDFFQLYLSIAFMYGVTPEAMQRHWSNVDMQFTVLQIPALPKENRYRHDSVPEFKTQ
jgi:hypothetical protein